MGVGGLWEVLRPAGQVRSLTELAVEDGFHANPAHQRGFRIGIDASIWFFHAAYGREGENPELRTLFFRCCRLLQTPLLPLFVFDGPNRPAVKRGKRVGGNAHWLTQGMKNIIDAFGFEWRVAPGEAEAELAYLNRIGIIDAVLSDDVDNFLFGATMVIRNPSNTLSGNRAHPVMNAQGRDDGNHVVTYTADAIFSNPSVALSRSGTILIGLLSGGDYIPAGLPGCGQKFATGLARAGFGDSLLKAIKELEGARLEAFLGQWRQEIRNELKTNRSGLLPSKKPSLAASLPDDFPSLPVLMSYSDPLTSENIHRGGNRKAQPVMWRNDPDPMRIASLCELYFEWGVKDIIVHRFRTVLWPGIVCRAVRRAVVDEDMRRRLPMVGAYRPGNQEEDSHTTAPSPSPVKQLSSDLFSLSLSSPIKKSSASGSSSSSPSTSDFFTLSSLVPLISTASSSTSRSASPSSPASAASPLLLEVLSERTHASTDSTLEYRVLIDPTTLVERSESGVKGLRPPLVGGLFGLDPEDENTDGGESASDDDIGGIERLETAAAAASKSGMKKRKACREVPTKPLRLWLPACMIRTAAPTLAEAYDEKMRVREEKKAKRGTKGRHGRRVGTGGNSARRTTKVDGDANDSESESVPGPSTPKKVGSKAKGRVARTGVGGSRRKPKQASEAQDDGYEFFDLSAGESPCSSDEGGVQENKEGKGKAKTETSQTNVTRPTTKASTKTDTTSRKATTTDSTTENLNTTKPSTMGMSMSKPSTARAPALNPAALKPVYEEEEDSANAVIMPPLPKSSRPLDLLRGRSKPGTGSFINPTSKFKLKTTATPRDEEERSSPSSLPTGTSKHNAPSLLRRPARPAPKAKKKPLFVEVSDTDSDIEVSDIRSLLPCTTASAATHDEDGNASTGIGISKTLLAFASEKNTGRVEDGVIDLTAKRGPSKSKSTPSTSMPMDSLLPLPVSAPLVTGSICSTSIARSPSKLAHILLPQSAPESEGEEESEKDELPTFHRGSSKSRMKKGIIRHAPRPFPMQLALESPVSPYTPKLSEQDERHEDDKYNCDGVEIVDVFTTPRGPSPPRSPTPSPSPFKPLPVHTSTGSSTSAKSRQPNGFLISPTRSQANGELHRKTRLRRHASPESDTPVSGNERDGILKSPRKSAAHSSPRHASGTHGRASSPTPLALSNSGFMQMGDTVGRKPRLSDTSAIYISSESEDDDNAAGIDHVQTEVNKDQNECTDQDINTWADTGLILTMPPSPAPPSDDPVRTAPAREVALPNPVRARSKFKPALATAPKVDVRTQTADRTTSTSLGVMTSDEDTAVSRLSCRAPLLVARAKLSKGRDDDIIDLTSD